MEPKPILGVFIVFLCLQSLESNRFLTIFRTAQNLTELFSRLLNAEPIACYSTCEARIAQYDLLFIMMAYHPGGLFAECKSKQEDKEKAFKGSETFLEDCDFFFNRTDVEILKRFRETNVISQRAIRFQTCFGLYISFSEYISRIEDFNISTSEKEINDHIAFDILKGFTESKPKNVSSVINEEERKKINLMNEFAEAANKALKQGMMPVLKKIRERNVLEKKEKYYLSVEATCSEEAV